MKNANTVSGAAGWLVAVSALLFAAGCGEGEAAGAAARAARPAADYFAIAVGGQAARMQLAVEQPGNLRELARGLMGRRDLAEDQGMVFVYRQPERMGFYMRNTPTPLDIGFFTRDGVLREVRQMFPFDETTVESARKDIQFALEMNQGWFERHGVRASPSGDAGARLDLSALAAALKARGFKPEDYGLRDDAAAR